MFSSEICEIFKNKYFEEQLDASDWSFCFSSECLICQSFFFFFSVCEGVLSFDNKLFSEIRSRESGFVSLFKFTK